MLNMAMGIRYMINMDPQLMMIGYLDRKAHISTDRIGEMGWVETTLRILGISLGGPEDGQH